MKVVGIGLNKTGTTTLGLCFEEFGLTHIGFSRRAFDLWRHQSFDILLEWVSKYDSFEDWPWPLVYKDIDIKFPGTKFVLTRRIDPDVWYESLCKHALRTGPTIYREVIYGSSMPQDHRERHIDIYQKHLADVRSYFRDRPESLLEVCWESGDGWKELAPFLGFEIPCKPFPHAGKSPT